MGVIWTSKTRTRQPTGPFLLNKASPLTQRIVALVPFGFGGMQDIVSGKNVILGSGALGVDYKGVSLRGSGSTACASVPLNLAAYSKIVISFWLYWDAFANDDDLAMEFTSSGSGPGGFAIDPNESATGRFQIFGRTGAGVGAKSFTRPSGAAWHHYMVELNSSTSGLVRSVYVDGVSQALTTDATGSGAGTFANSTLYLFSRNNTSLFGAGRIQNLVVRGGVDLLYSEVLEEYRNPWQLFAPEKRPLFFSTGGGANNTGTLAVTLDAATLTGVGGVSRSGTLATTLDAATLAGVGNVTRSGTLAVTLDAATLSGTGAVTTSGTLAVTLDAATLAGVGSVAVGTNRDGALAVTLDSATLAGVGAVTRSGTLAVTLDAATLAGVGTVGQAVTGTLGVTLGNVTLAGIGAIPAAPSAGGGKTFGSNKKKKKQRKAIESEEWLKAEETAKQLLQDRFTRTTPEAKLEALASHIESLQPVIEALKALAREDVQEVVQETRTEELTEHQLVLNRFDALEKKIESVEELLIILMADL